MLPTEHNRTQELGPFPAPLYARLMPSDEQFTRVARPQHLSPDQDRRHHDGMRPVDGQRFNPAKTGQWTPVLCRKCHVVAKVRDCSTRLDPAHHISLRKVLVLDRDHGLHKDSRPSQLHSVTVGTLIDRFIAEYAPKRCRKPTQRVYRSLFDYHIRPRWGTEFVQNIKTVCVEKWLEEYPHSRQIKSHVRNLMHTLYEAAIRWELVERNPVSLVRQSRKRLKTPRVLAPPEFKALLLELDEPYKTMVTIACLGLRVCELLALQWGDINFENLAVKVQRSFVEGHVYATKNEASTADPPLDPDLADLLLNHQRQSSFPGNSDFIFAGDCGEPRWPDILLTDHIKPAARRVGIGNIGWHTFRHTYSTLLHALGTTPAVQKEFFATPTFKRQ